MEAIVLSSMTDISIIESPMGDMYLLTQPTRAVIATVWPMRFPTSEIIISSAFSLPRWASYGPLSSRLRA